MALDRDPRLCNRIHLKALGESTLLLPHAEEGLPYPVPGPTASISSPTPWPLSSAVVCTQPPWLPISPTPSSPRRPEPASPAEPTSTTFSPASPVSHGRIACSSVTPPPAISGGANNADIPCCWYDPPRHRPAGRPPHRLPHHRPAPALRYRLTLTESPEASLPGFLIIGNPPAAAPPSPALPDGRHPLQGS